MAEKTDLSENLAYGIDLKNRRIYFGSNLDMSDSDTSTDFTISSVELAVRAMHKMISDAPNKPIEIHMCSYGGDPYAMLRLHDEILSSPCQIKFIGSGVVMSAATWIMAVCDERYLHANTTVMVHDGSDGFEGKHTDAQIQAAEMKRLQNLLYDIYANNSRMPRDFWQDVCQRDLYLNSEEALTLGLIDKIIEPRKRGNLRRARQAIMRKNPSPKDIKGVISAIYGRINKVKIPKIELNEIKKEPVDPSLWIEEEKAPVEINQPSPVESVSGSGSAT